MGSHDHALFLRAEAPLQAWGDHAQHSDRNIHGRPTLSGIVGLSAAALGIKRTEVDRIIDMMNSLIMGVRVDRPGALLNDFQMHRDAFHHGDGSKPMMMNGQYVCDASFLVVLCGEQSRLNEIAEALLNPYYPLVLGRHNCPPSASIFPALSGAPVEAVPTTSLREAILSFPKKGDVQTPYERELLPGEEPLPGETFPVVRYEIPRAAKHQAWRIRRRRLVIGVG